MSSQKQRKLAAIMFTDMVGYTTLSQKNESLSLSVLEEQRKLVRPILARFNCREVKTIGDAFLIEFASALEAVKCAYEIQKAAREFNASTPEERRINLRIGIHLGDIVESEGDITGDAVNVASRIGPFAEKGGISLSRQVYDQVQNKFELPILSIGPKALKNVTTPVEVYKIDMQWSGEKSSRPTHLDKSRIAVLPFANISPNPSDEYFADGMTEELIATLSRIRELGVIARTSITRYKGLTKPVTEIGRELNVGTVLEGSVRVAGKKLRITAQLIDAASEEHLWSASYDRELEDIFAIQTDIATRIAKELKVKILRTEKIRLEKKATGIPEAYSLYLKGRHSLNARSEKSLKEAIRHFDSAIRHDPDFALAYTGLADAYSILASYSLEYIPPNEGFPKAKAAAEKALALDDHLAEAHASLGLVKFYYDWDWAGAEAEFKKAIELNPGYAQAHQYYADFVKSFGRFDEALKEMRSALVLDPLSYSINTGIGHVLYLSRQYDQALDHYRSVVESDPAFVPARLWYGRPYMQKGMFKEAIDQLKQAVKLSNESTVSLATLAQAYASAGQTREARALLDQLMERSKKQYVPAYWIALVQMSMGNRDEAISWLEKAYNERSSWLVWANVEPRFDILRSDPRFGSLLKRIGFRN
ncbi:tetratricopeptide repeat protein [Candidatus Bathyarchaeota archaeon]|nr:tetratricopeptide repeat protein [Candidatus Bathyarchaeota archaeon]